MSLRPVFLGLAALAALAAPAPAGEFDKYLPENSQFFAHVRVPKLFESEMVRTAVPMAFDKHGDQIAMFAGMAKALNPNAPDIPEDQLKQGIKQMSDPKKIAEAFDVAKTLVTDVVVAGTAEGGTPSMVTLIKCGFITAEGAEMAAGMAGANPQVQLKKIAKDKGTIYAVTIPQAGQTVYLCVPEPGILHVSLSEEQSASAFTAKGKPGDKLAALMAKAGAEDFVFVAGLGGDEQDYASMVANVGLDKNLNGKAAITYKDAAKAVESAKEMNDKFAEMVARAKEHLGARPDALGPQLIKGQASASGPTVNATFMVAGAAVEALLKKD